MPEPRETPKPFTVQIKSGGRSIFMHGPDDVKVHDAHHILIRREGHPDMWVFADKITVGGHEVMGLGFVAETKEAGDG